MTLSTSTRQARKNRWLQTLLAGLLVFAAWHVASHEVETSSELSGHAQCHVCRLSFTPIADLPALLAIVSFVLPFTIFITSVRQRLTLSCCYVPGARAPPLL